MGKVKVVELAKNVRDEVLRRSAELRRWFEERGITAIEFLGAPGSGKTTVIECLVKLLIEELRCYNPTSIAYVGGDVATTFDVSRIARHGVQCVQVNTGGICHLEPEHVIKALNSLEDPSKVELVLIENVGNLVCPFFAPLGVHAKVLVLDAAAGPDKPLKYPHAVKSCSVVVVNKVDLIRAEDLEILIKNIRAVVSSPRMVKMCALKCEGVRELHRELIEIAGLRTSYIRGS